MHLFDTHIILEDRYYFPILQVSTKVQSAKKSKVIKRRVEWDCTLKQYLILPFHSPVEIKGF